MLMPLSQAQRARFATRTTWLSVVGLLLVPLVVGGLLTWALWDPETRLDRVSAAIVNNDEPVQLNGQTVPLGRQLAAGLVTGQGTGGDAEDPEDPATGAGAVATDAVPNVSGAGVTTTFDWVLSDSADAADGLASGRYDVVLTIPSDFSAKATSYTGDASAASRATFDVTTSTRARPMDGAIAQVLATTAADVLGTELTKGYLSQVLVSFATLHDSLGEAADGAGQLSDGAGRLATGASDLSSGLGQLADGAADLASGVDQVSGGASDLASGLDQITAQLRSAASQAQAGVPQARQFAAGLSAAAAGVTGPGGLADGASGLAGGAAQTAGGVAQLSSGLTGLLDNLDQLAQGCQLQVPGTCDQLVAVIQAQRDLDTFGGQPTVTASAEQLAAGAQQLAAGAQDLSAGISTGSPTQPALGPSLTQLAGAGQQLADGTAASATGLGTLASYVGQSADGAHELSGGAGQAASGADDLAGGAQASAAGAGEIATGVDGIAGGASDLADGLGEAVAQIPTYTQGEATSLADVIASPIEATESSVPLGTAAVPMLMALALWLGAMAVYLVLSPLGREAMGSPRSSLALAWQSFWPAAGIGAGQAVLLTAVMGAALDLDLAQWLRFGGLAVLAAVALTAVNQGLAALLGGVGRFVAVVVAAVTLATGVISTAPGLLTGLAALLPTAPLVSGLRAAVQSESGLAAAAVTLALWALVGLAAATAAIARRRVVDIGTLTRPAAASHAW